MALTGLEAALAAAVEAVLVFNTLAMARRTKRLDAVDVEGRLA
jgi:hypothetical protein